MVKTIQREQKVGSSFTILKKLFKSGFTGKILILYLLLFPLGQLIRIELPSFSFPIHPTDLLAGLTVILVSFNNIKANKLFVSFLSFLFVGAFSLVLSLGYFSKIEIMVGSFYLLRLFAYSTFFLSTWNLTRHDSKMKKFLYDALIVVAVFVGIFGWMQYFWFPDLRSLKYIGWDDHLYRLVGTLLDPTFTGIVLVFGFLLVLTKFVYFRNKNYFLYLVFFLFTILFTYARAAYLALAVSVLFIFYLSVRQKIGGFNKVRRFAFVFILGVGVLLPLLPRTAGEGVKLERMFSVYAKIENYQQTYQIIKKYPLFGVGFNNMCAARIRILGGSGYGSHACSGSDSSLLLVLATTGIVGLLIFLNTFLLVIKGVRKDIYGFAFLGCVVALLTHSLFVNSLFYPWVMGWMGILLSLAY